MLTLENPYSTAPRFDELAAAVPAFAPYLCTTSKGKPTIDFRDPAAVRALTSALLERDFRVTIKLPEDRLCPIVPGRLEYVRWILELADCTLASSPGPPAFDGLDIGTGSSCIYPLLGCRSLPSLTFVATDIDEHSLSYARHNVTANQLSDRIDLRHVGQDDGLFPSGEFDFTMCNPPFYSSAEDVDASLATKELEPFAVCTGGVTEMITEGGEVAFVGRMVEESLAAGDRIRWFSSLLGKYSSVAQIVALSKKRGIENYTIAETVQGQTKRYLIAWSLQSARLNSMKYHPPAASFSNPAVAKLLPPSNAHTYFCPPSLGRVEVVRSTLDSILGALDGVILDWGDEEPLRGFLRASRNSWSRSARRGKAQESDSAMEVDSPVSPTSLLLVATLMVKLDGEQVKVEAEWTMGFDRARKDWTTLWAYVIRKLADRAKEVDAAARGEKMDEL